MPVRPFRGIRTVTFLRLCSRAPRNELVGSHARPLYRGNVCSTSPAGAGAEQRPGRAVPLRREEVAPVLDDEPGAKAAASDPSHSGSDRSAPRRGGPRAPRSRARTCAPGRRRAGPAHGVPASARSQGRSAFLERKVNPRGARPLPTARARRRSRGRRAVAEQPAEERLLDDAVETFASRTVAARRTTPRVDEQLLRRSDDMRPVPAEDGGERVSGRRDDEHPARDGGRPAEHEAGDAEHREQQRASERTHAHSSRDRAVSDEDGFDHGIAPFDGWATIPCNGNDSTRPSRRSSP